MRKVSRKLKTLKKGVSQVSHLAQDNPLKTLGITFVAGVVLGYFVHNNNK